MKVLFALSAFGILYTYLGYPFLISVWAKLHPRSWQRASWPFQEGSTQASETIPPPISIVMAVHNGAALLSAQLEHLLGLEAALVLEVIVISDGSSDATNTILQATSNPRLRKILLTEQVGKASALNHGIAAAAGSFLLFVDIRPTIQPGAVASLLSNFADPRVGCAAGELLLRTAAHDATATAVSGLYWRYEQAIRNCEATVDSPVGVYGGFYMVRRALAVPYPPGTVLDDMYQPLSIIRKGFRSVLDPRALVVDTWPEKIAGEFARQVRTLAGNFQLIQIAPWLLTPQNRVLMQLISHKLMRLVVPYLFVLTLFSSIALALTTGGPPRPYTATFFFLLAATQIAFWLLALISLRFSVPLFQRIAAPAGALLVLNAAAVMGLGKFLFTRGPLWKIWSPTAAAMPGPERGKESGR